VDEAYFSGLSAELKSDYIRHYAAGSVLAIARWKSEKLSECLLDSLLRRSDWYNDFALASGARDILGARLADTATHCAIFGIHQQIGCNFPDKVDSLVNLVTLKRAVRHHIERLGSKVDADDKPGTQILAEGSRLYFHIDNGRRYPNETGSVFSTSDEATAHAFAVAQELAQDGSWHGYSVRVTDERGLQITKVRIGRLALPADRSVERSATNSPRNCFPPAKIDVGHGAQADFAGL
jgi:hypothetical protein